MTENEPVLSKEKELSFEDRAILALARVQGHWNSRGMELLTLEAPKFEEDDGEEKLPAVATKFATSFVGDGSEAKRMLGKSVILSGEESGLILLVSLLDRGGSANVRDWINLSLLSREVKTGKPLGTVLDSVGKRIGGITKIGALFAVLDPEIKEDLVQIKSKIGELLTYLKTITGGSEESLEKNKKKLEETIIYTVGNKLLTMNHDEVGRLYGLLDKKFEEDDILTKALSGARKIMKENLETRISLLTRAVIDPKS